MKLNRRRHMEGGPELVRVCVCDDCAPAALELQTPQLFCPVCQLRPAVRPLASSGEQLFPGVDRKESPVGATELRRPEGVAWCEPLGRPLL